MAHFYGTLQGNRGEATRCGTRHTGIVTRTASWNGAVKVSLYYAPELDTDCARIELIPWHGGGTSRVIYEGPVSGHPVSDYEVKI